MRLSRRPTTVLLALVVAGALAPAALAGKKWSPPPQPAPTYVAPAPTYVAPAPISTSMVDIEALR